MSNQIYSIQLERKAIGGLLKHPKFLAEVDNFVTENDFYSETHNTIFCVLRNSILNGETVDKTLISHKISSMGIKFRDDIDIHEYLDDISHTTINEKGLKKVFQELVTLKIRRELRSEHLKAIQLVENPGDKSVDEIIAACDDIQNNKVNLYTQSEGPENIFEGLQERIEARAASPVEDIGLLTPFPVFNRLFGGLRGSNIYAFGARPGQGKTTLLSEMAFGVHKRYCNEKDPVHILYLDTEMEKEDFENRMLASITGVPFNDIETGSWIRVEEYVPLMRKAFQEIKKYRFYHYKVNNRPIQQIESIIRRWYYSVVGRSLAKGVNELPKCLFVYDYLKMTGEKGGNNWAEHQIMGEKVDRIKLMANEINAPGLSAIQTNRSGEGQGRRASDIDDSSAAFSQTDRLQWFGSFTGIWRQKTLDEISEDGQEFGTHLLIKTKGRFQGKEARGFQDIHRRTFSDGTEKWVNNYLNYNIDNFRVEERGSLEDIIEKQKLDFDVSDEGDDGKKEYKLDVPL